MTETRESRQLDGIAGYLAAIDQVPGWFFPPDTLLFAAVDNFQRERGVTGDLLEIGVYKGRSAILMGFFAGPGERLVVCDLFEEMDAISEENEQERRHYAKLHDLDLPARKDFEGHYLRFHPALPEIMQMRSDRLNGHLPAGTFRMIHIDGGHTMEVVQQDIETARRLLGAGGVVIFDDWANGQQPGVALAIWQEYLKGDLIPLGFTPSKFYATWDPEGMTYTDVSDWAAGQPDMAVTYPHRLAGREAAYLSMHFEYWQRQQA